MKYLSVCSGIEAASVAWIGKRIARIVATSTTKQTKEE